MTFWSALCTQCKPNLLAVSSWCCIPAWRMFKHLQDRLIQTWEASNSGKELLRRNESHQGIYSSELDYEQEHRARVKAPGLGLSTHGSVYLFHSVPKVDTEAVLVAVQKCLAVFKIAVMSVHTFGSGPQTSPQPRRTPARVNWGWGNVSGRRMAIETEPWEGENS